MVLIDISPRVCSLLEDPNEYTDSVEAAVAINIHQAQFRVQVRGI